MRMEAVVGCEEEGCVGVCEEGGNFEYESETSDKKDKRKVCFRVKIKNLKKEIIIFYLKAILGFFKI